MLDDGAVIWIVGPPASGKTTLAQALHQRLRAAKVAVLWLDSDDLRPLLTPHAGYDADARDIFYEALGHLAVLGSRGGVTVLISATASRKHYREEVRRQVEHFFEISLRCPLAERQRRDPKGLYRKARTGKIKNLPGFDTSFEESTAPELTLDTQTTPLPDLIDTAWSRVRELLALP